MSTGLALSFSMSSTTVARYVGRDRIDTAAPITSASATQIPINRRRLTTTDQYSAKCTSAWRPPASDSVLSLTVSKSHTLRLEKRFRHDDDVVGLQSRVRLFPGNDRLIVDLGFSVFPVRAFSLDQNRLGSPIRQPPGLGDDGKEGDAVIAVEFQSP